MARFAIALFAVLFVAVLAAMLIGRTAHSRDGHVATIGPGDSQMQKVAFFLLIALILYVSASGGA